MIYLLTNEYVTSYIESSSDIHYYFFDVQEDCDFIKIEFQSESFYYILTVKINIQILVSKKGN